MHFGHHTLGIFVGILENSTWKESSVPPSGRFGNELSDSSSSEAEKETHGIVHFVLGDGPEEPARAFGKTAPYKEKSNIIRSYSQDTNILVNEDKAPSFLPKTSYSENSLDVSDRSSYHPATALATTMTAMTTTTTVMTTATTGARKLFKELPTVMSVDDETLSTDSNSTADNDELKRRRRKLPFAAFRKNKTKIT